MKAGGRGNDALMRAVETIMKILKDYRDYLLEKTPRQKQVQYFWLALSGALLAYGAFSFSADTIVRSLLLLVIGASLAIDAATNLAYFTNKPLFSRLVNIKIAANIISLLYIVVFLVLSSRQRP
jgi:hypothetical protein